jgi:protein ImuB
MSTRHPDPARPVRPGTGSGRRILALHLPLLAIDRQVLIAQANGAADAARHWRHSPAACHAPGPRGPMITTPNPAARAAGVRAGMTLAEARARTGGDILLAPADPRGDRRALACLADLADRFSPAVGLDGDQGLLLDITGVAHLFRGEAGLIARAGALIGARGFGLTAAIAPTPLAASALARARADQARADHRMGTGSVAAVVVANDRAMSDEIHAALARLVGPLPPEMLSQDGERLRRIAEGLARLGIRRIDALDALPRSSVAERFGPGLLDLLDRLYDRAPDPLHPRRPQAPAEVRMSWAEPIGRAEDIAAATAALVGDLVADLGAAGLGARRLALSVHLVDGRLQRVELGLALASREPRHMMRLLAERLDRIDPGLGIEVMVLAAPVVQPLADLDRPLPGLGQTPLSTGTGGAAVAALIDRIDARLGNGRVRAVRIEAGVMPETAIRLIPAAIAPEQAMQIDDGPHRATAPRPARLLTRPEPALVVAALPDDPPARLRWRGRLHRVHLADGPERLTGPWWESPGAPAEARDYYRVETEEGLRLWVFRSRGSAGLALEDGGSADDGAPEHGWFVHGIFA